MSRLDGRVTHPDMLQVTCRSRSKEIQDEADTQRCAAQSALKSKALVHFPCHRPRADTEEPLSRGRKSTGLGF